MKYLFGLKDEDGNEYKMLAEPRSNVFMGGVISLVEKPLPVPEFKVPGWFVFNDPDDNIIFRAISATKYYLSDGVNSYDKCHSRSATPAEIESHLRKICDEKYDGKKVRSAYNPDNIFNVSSEPHRTYDESDDTYYYNYNAVYCKGKFAEIIPDKKSLPRTRGEYEEFLNDFSQRYWEDEITTVSMKEFLNEYES